MPPRVQFKSEPAGNYWEAWRFLIIRSGLLQNGCRIQREGGDDDEMSARRSSDGETEDGQVNRERVEGLTPMRKNFTLENLQALSPHHFTLSAPKRFILFFWRENGSEKCAIFSRTFSLWSLLCL